MFYCRRYPLVPSIYFLSFLPEPLIHTEPDPDPLAHAQIIYLGRKRS